MKEDMVIEEHIFLPHGVSRDTRKSTLNKKSKSIFAKATYSMVEKILQDIARPKWSSPNLRKRHIFDVNKGEKMMIYYKYVKEGLLKKIIKKIIFKRTKSLAPTSEKGG